MQKLTATRGRRGVGGEAVVLLLLVLVIIAGIAWWLFSSRGGSEADARSFARELAARLATHHDRKFLNAQLSRQAEVQYPPSFRDRLLERLQRLGVAQGPFELKGRVMFVSHFFSPTAEFRIQLNYPNAPPAFLDVGMSRAQMRWQLDYLNLTYEPAPVALPAPDSSPPPEASP